MFGLTLKETIILIIVLVLICSIVVSIAKHSIKFILIAILISILFSGFTWVPEQLNKWLNAEGDNSGYVDPNMSYNNLNETINDVSGAVNSFVSENKDSWIIAGKSLWNKIQGGEGYAN